MRPRTWSLAIAVAVAAVALVIWQWRSDTAIEAPPQEAGEAAMGELVEDRRSGAQEDVGDKGPGTSRLQGAGLSEEVAAPPPAPVGVRGLVLSKQEGTPVPFVDVIFASKGGESTATSNERGEYGLVLVPGSYQVRAIGDRVMAIGLPPFRVEKQAREYNITVVEHSAIRGQVFFADRSPGAGALLVPELIGKSASGSTARGELGSAEVQDDGSFELFTLQGDLIVHATTASAAGSVRVLGLKAGETRDKVQITLVPNGYIEGSVRDPSGKAIAEAKVLASMQIPGTGEYDRIPVATDASGHFRYQVLRPAHTIVEASALGYAQSSPQDFTLQAGESRKEIVLVLHEANLSLSGRVVDSAGEPLAFVEIAQGQEGSKERYKKAYTNRDGEFQIEGLGPGPHRLRARKSGFEQTRLRDIQAPAADLRIEMTAGSAPP